MTETSAVIECRVVMAAITGVCATAAASVVVPIVEHLIGAVLIGGGLVLLAVAVVRRELRVRRRRADTCHEPWAGPGDRSPTPPTPTTPTRTALPRATAPAVPGATERTGGAP